MKYTQKDLRDCCITENMLLDWFWSEINRGVNKYQENNIDFEVIINGEKVENPLSFFKEIENNIEAKIDENVKILDDFEKDIEGLRESMEVLNRKLCSIL